MTIRIENLMGKFGLKGMNYEPIIGGKALLSLDEQLAAVGITWHHSPVGFLLLMAEYCSDATAIGQLRKACLVEANELMQGWRGSYPDKALEALVVTAILEATQQEGQICPECNGVGKVKNKHRVTRKCACCDKGRIKWTNETRFAVFCRNLPITYSRFNRYKPVAKSLVDWLLNQRTAAMLAITGRMAREEDEAKKVA